MSVRKIAQGLIERIDPASVVIEGYAAIFNVEFDWFDPFEWSWRRFVIPPGAFTSVLERQDGRPLDVYWRHETWALQLGQTSVLRQDEIGLWYKASPFVHSAALDILGVMDGRDRTGASFQFDFGEIRKNEDTGVEALLNFSNLYEVGPCPQGANPAAWSELVDVAAERDNDLPEPADETAGLSAETLALVRRLRKEGALR